MGFPRQEYWSRLPFPSLGDLLNPGIKPTSPSWRVDSLPLATREALVLPPESLIYDSYKHTLFNQ